MVINNFIKISIIFSIKATPILADIVSSSTYKTWEVEDALDRLRLEIEIYNKSPEISKKKH